MRKMMMVVTLALAAPAAFGAETAAQKPVAQIQTLRSEVKRDEADLTAKWKAAGPERKALRQQQGAELAKIRAGEGTRGDKKAACQAVRRKYAQLFKETREKRRIERRRLREDAKSKKNQILRLRETP
ncbi:MAG TPA: hypothetical protein DCZ01_03915 [Elusimicrobia bacterium]|nr:MAG: hypothetical protein A2X37_07835 [Elusimicrobia bacterium GWA2_66_18]OGR70555.1 MAG: hypothetical protein A2X40_04710 [Elusimicrobia bacterium GWC2_65_9]HAZ07673.1 hypothetical protein [Elusimicrobiota bacterium]